MATNVYRRAPRVRSIFNICPRRARSAFFSFFDAVQIYFGISRGDFITRRKFIRRKIRSSPFRRLSFSLSLVAFYPSFFRERDADSRKERVRARLYHATRKSLASRRNLGAVLSLKSAPGLFLARDPARRPLFLFCGPRAPRSYNFPFLSFSSFFFFVFFLSSSGLSQPALFPPFLLPLVLALACSNPSPYSLSLSLLSLRSSTSLPDALARGFIYVFSAEYTHECPRTPRNESTFARAAFILPAPLLALTPRKASVENRCAPRRFDGCVRRVPPTRSRGVNGITSDPLVLPSSLAHACGVSCVAYLCRTILLRSIYEGR